MTLGCSDGNEDSFSRMYRGAQIGAELHPIEAIPLQKFGKILLMNGNLTLSQPAYLGFIIIYADDLMSDLRKARGGDKSDIP